MGIDLFGEARVGLVALRTRQRHRDTYVVVPGAHPFREPEEAAKIEVALDVDLDPVEGPSTIPCQAFR